MVPRLLLPKVYCCVSSGSALRAVGDRARPRLSAVSDRLKGHPEKLPRPPVNGSDAMEVRCETESFRPVEYEDDLDVVAYADPREVSDPRLVSEMEWWYFVMSGSSTGRGSCSSNLCSAGGRDDLPCQVVLLPPSDDRLKPVVLSGRIFDEVSCGTPKRR